METTANTATKNPLRRLLEWLTHKRSHDACVSPDIRRLVGEAGWRALPATVRSRFPSEHAEPVRYFGNMHMVRCNSAGIVLANLARLVGTPIAPGQGTNVPVTVDVFADARSRGEVWRRTYHFANRPPVTVHSIKSLDAHDGTLIECLGGRLRMRLTVFERDRMLHFVSNGYYIDLGICKLSLPGFLHPGRTHVTHRDEGNRQFRFTLTIRHPWLGELFYQDGLFQAEETQ